MGAGVVAIYRIKTNNSLQKLDNYQIWENKYLCLKTINWEQNLKTISV